MRKTLWPSLLLIALAASGCAGKKFVRTEVGDVNAKVESLVGSVEQMQGRLSQDEAKIGQADAKADAAGQSAQRAQNSATAAAQAARQVDTKVDRMSANLSADITSGRKLVYEVTLSEDQGNFRSGKADLPDAARARLDQVIDRLKRERGKDIYIEVEGHTDNVGTPVQNRKMGLARAEAVQRYLYTQHAIPLHKISVFSFGQEHPVAPNTTREGRAQNRRVVVRVLS